MDIGEGVGEDGEIGLGMVIIWWYPLLEVAGCDDVGSMDARGVSPDGCERSQGPWKGGDAIREHCESPSHSLDSVM